MRRRIGPLAVGLLTSLLCTSCALVRPATTRLLGEARVTATPLPLGTIPLPSRTGETPAWGAGGPVSLHYIPTQGPARRLIEQWADQDLPDWQEEGKVTAPRVILAKLALGRDVEAVNAYLLSAKPWAGIGSTWALRQSGDYDFSLPPLTAALYLFGERPELLHPETRDHLVETLLNQAGSSFRRTVPGSLGLVGETENHILMTEGSRYLKNQWLRQHGSDAVAHNNAANGLETKLLDYLDELDRAGLYEFNSNPYVGYTAMALLTLEAFAEQSVAEAARRVLDRINTEYAYGSLLLQRYAPYRRQTSRAGITELSDHPHTSMMRVWTSLAGSDVPPVEKHTHQAVYAALMPYRLPDATATLAMTADRSHYVRIGRGPGSSPEIYSAGDGYLLSAGGVGRGRSSQIVMRLISLILTNGAGDASELWRIGDDASYWSGNRTGVLPGVAVGRPPLTVPCGVAPTAAAGAWTVYHDATSGVTVACGETSYVGVIYALDREAVADLGMNENQLASRLADLTGSDDLDAGLLYLPDGRQIVFDLSANADTWVIVSVNGEAMDRELTRWPRLDGWADELPK
mgnify:CR=1 FL=1